MATWKKVVVEDSTGHMAQTAAKADHLNSSTNNAPEVVYQSGSTTNYLDKGSAYQVLRMNSAANAIEYTSGIVETRDVNQTIQGEKLFSEDLGLTKPSDATNGNQSVDSGRFRFKRSHWANSQANTDTLQMQIRQDTVDTNDVAKWEWVVGTPDASDNDDTDAIFLVNEEGSATVNKYLTITGGQIRNTAGNACITLASNSGVDIGGDLKVVGNDIKGSAGNTCITLNTGAGNNGITIAGDLTVSGDTTTVNTSTLSVEDKIIELASGATDAASASLAGINVNTTNGTQEPTLLWTNGATLTGWGVKPEGEDVTYPLSVMTQSGSAGSGNSAGVGTFHYDTSGDDLYIRTA